ncbi:MAG: DUF499 domain-containing protein, partial [Anaerolineae bacterium]
MFAAQFGQVVNGTARKVYQDPHEFERNTYPAAHLKTLVGTIFERLANPHEAGAAIRLSTGFGGGKTHALITLWHLARNIADTSYMTELLPAAGRPHKVVVAGIDAGEFGAKVCGTHGSLQTHSLWGELAYQLGHEKGYATIRENDDPLSLPSRAQIRSLLPPEPTLILLDELVIYLSILDAQAQSQLLAFINALVGEVGARSQAVLVITDPAGQPAYEKMAEKLISETQLHEADRRLSDVLGRAMSNEEVIGKETAQIIQRRLFDKIDLGAAHEASAEYHSTYKRIVQEDPGVLPEEAAKVQYAEEIVKCYPFHPRLLETVQGRLTSLQDFNQSRGMLRLFARIVRDVFDSQSDIGLITAGDLDWAGRRMQADLLERIKRHPFKAAVEADVVRHAGELDAQHGTDMHRRVASALLLESLQLTPTSALDRRELALAVLRAGDVGHEPAEALDRLLNVCWHTYKTESGQKYQFRYEPNVIKIIEERANDPQLAEDAKQAVLSLAQSYFGGNTFKLVAYPSSPRAVPDSAALKLVLCDTEKQAQAVCDYEDDSDPAAPMPRRFRNAILGVAPTAELLREAQRAMRWLLAARAVAGEHKKGTPLRQQVDELLPKYERDAQLSTVQAFNRVVFQGRAPLRLTERYQVAQSSPLGPANGQALLMDFLTDNNLIYKPEETLAVDLLVDEIMRGATPSVDYDGAFPASAVHERALAHERLRLMATEAPVRSAVLQAVSRGRLVVRQPDGDAYDQHGRVTGGVGTRRRLNGERLTTLKLTRDVLLARVEAPCAAEWLQVDQPDGGGGGGGYEMLTIEEAAVHKNASLPELQEAIDLALLHTKVVDGQVFVIRDEAFVKWTPRRISGGEEVVAYTWEEAIAYAETRPLIMVRLSASALGAADKLAACAQPFAASSLTLSTTVSGKLKDGGLVNLAVSDARHNTPLR